MGEEEEEVRRWERKWRAGKGRGGRGGEEGPLHEKSIL